MFGFVVLTRYEKVRGARVFNGPRTQLDERIYNAQFILKHVDLPAFLQEELERFMRVIGHAIAHLSLQLVRATERLLTRLVRHLRTQHTEPLAPRESARPFVKTLSAFKDTLKTNAPNPDDFDIK